MPPINLTGLYPHAYEHPHDAAALNVLQHTPGFDILIRKMSAWGIERQLRIEYTGSSLHVTEKSFPGLWEMMISARDRISLPITPGLYITDGEQINAFTAGVEKPIVVLNHGAIERLEEDELLFIIGHELGHIKSGHVLYYQIADYIPKIAGALGELTFGIGEFLSRGLMVALMHWQRASELSADRAGLLACQSPETAYRTTMKMSGMPEKMAAKAKVEDFIQQARDFEALDGSMIDKVAKFIMTSGLDHPWTVLRAKELLQWVETGGYDHILNLPYPLQSQPKQVKIFCDHCGSESSPTDKFCRKCGTALPTAAIPAHPSS